LAKLSGPSQAMSHQTKTGSLLGTPHYMAPEQAENVKKVDHRADVYSLGCILFQMLTARVPFPGEGFGEVLVRHVREPPPLPSRLNPAVPPALEKIVLHALAKKPDFRFASMDEFRSALRDPERFSQTLDGQGGVQLTPDAGVAAVGVAGMGPPPDAPPSPSGRFPQQSPRAVSNDAPTMLAQPAPDAAAIARAQAEAQKQRHESAPAPRRPDPQRVVSARPAKATVAEPLSGGRLTVPRSRGPLIAVVAAVAAVVLGGVGWYFAVGPGHKGTVAVTVTTDPAGADVYDGELLVGAAPVVVKVARDGEPHRIVVKKDGYLTAQRVVMGKDDQPLKLRLTPKPVEEKEEAPPPPKPVAVAQTPPPPKAEPPKPQPPKKHHPRPKKEDTLILTPAF
jgi:hypothetical protein